MNMKKTEQMFVTEPENERLGFFQDNEKDFILVHAIFALICIAVLLFPLKQPIGIRLMVLVIVYNLIMPLWGLFRKDPEWISLWLFAFILSIFMVFPDWFLSKYMDVLVFPKDGLFKIGTVSAYMAGLWAIPVFIIVFLGDRTYIRYSNRVAYIVVGVISFIIFTLAEQISWMFPSWYAQNVFMLGHIALYIIVPEVILGLTAYFAYQYISKLSVWHKFPAAFLVMQLYLGSAVFFYFLVELKFF